jgi:YcaO-like protein with predicted kinase domain
MKKKIITLRSCPKNYTYDQDKACSPKETVARFQERLQACRLDILQDIRRIDNGRLDIPVYFSLCGADARRIIGNKKQMGKGSTSEQARASACMELGERFSFFSFLRNSDNFLIGDYEAMEAQGHPVLPIETLLHSVHDVHLSPDLLRRLLAGLPLRWTWAQRLADATPVLVPFSWFYAINEFNGPSAGNTYEEAALQGMCEVIERHVCALVTRDRLATPKIDPVSITDPVALELLDKFRNNGIEVHLSDFSLDTGIPTIGALAWDPATFPHASEIVYTAGTTPDANKALIRALTEVAQLAGDFNTGSNYVASGLPKPLSLDEVDHVLHSRSTVALAEMSDLADEDIHQEVNNCVAALQARGMEVLVIDTPILIWRSQHSTPLFPVPISGNGPWAAMPPCSPPSWLPNCSKVTNSISGWRQCRVFCRRPISSIFTAVVISMIGVPSPRPCPVLKRLCRVFPQVRICRICIPTRGAACGISADTTRLSPPWKKDWPAIKNDRISLTLWGSVAIKPVAMPKRLIIFDVLSS